MNEIDNRSDQGKKHDQPVPPLLSVVPVGVINTEYLKQEDRGIEAVHRIGLRKTNY
jgi:hypothetical protein